MANSRNASAVSTSPSSGASTMNVAWSMVDSDRSVSAARSSTWNSSVSGEKLGSSLLTTHRPDDAKRPNGQQSDHHNEPGVSPNPVEATIETSIHWIVLPEKRWVKMVRQSGGGHHGVCPAGVAHASGFISGFRLASHGCRLSARTATVR